MQMRAIPPNASGIIGHQSCPVCGSPEDDAVVVTAFLVVEAEDVVDESLAAVVVVVVTEEVVVAVSDVVVVVVSLPASFHTALNEIPTPGFAPTIRNSSPG